MLRILTSFDSTDVYFLLTFPRQNKYFALRSEMDHNQENRCDKSAADEAFKNQLKIISSRKKICRVSQKNFIDEIKAQLRIPRAPTGFCVSLSHFLYSNTKGIQEHKPVKNNFSNLHNCLFLTFFSLLSKKFLCCLFCKARFRLIRHEKEFSAALILIYIHFILLKLILMRDIRDV